MGESVKKEERMSERFPYHCLLKYMALGNIQRPPDKVLTEESILDISSGGMRVQTRERGLEKGAMLKVLLPIYETKVTVPVLTEVMWVKEERPGTFHAGLRFAI